jgi:hypothetical protein
MKIILKFENMEIQIDSYTPTALITTLANSDMLTMPVKKLLIELVKTSEEQLSAARFKTTLSGD